MGADIPDRITVLQRKRTLALAGGVMAALGHAPFGLWPIALIGFALLIWATHSATSRSFAVGWFGGLGYFAFTLHWIVEPFLVDIATHGWMAPFALTLMAGGLALFWGLAAMAAARIGAGAIGFAVALTLAELARGHVFTGFPWALPAYIWTDTQLRMMAAVVGPYGLTFLTLMLIAMPMTVSRMRRRVLVGVLSFGVLVAMWGLSALWDDPGFPVEGPTVLLVNPDAPQDEKWHPETAFDYMQAQLDFTAEGTAAHDIDLVVWPEAAVVYPLDRAAPFLEQMAEAAKGVPVLTGINRRTVSEWFNSSVLVDASGQVAQTSDKVHLVPFGEYIPFRIDILRAMAARSDYGFSPGEAVRTIETPIGRALILICYEAIFPGHIARAETRPDVLIQITNDAWFGTFAGPFQHLQQARFRAVEQGLPLIRVANVGVNAMIDARGEIVAKLPFGQAGWLEAQVPALRAPTVYSRTGDGPLAVMLLFTFFVLSFLARAKNVASQRRAS